MRADGSKVDDLASAARLHGRQHGGDAMQHAADVDVDHTVPLLNLHRRERRQRHDPGIVDHDIDRAEGLGGEVGESLGVGEAGHIDGAEARGAACSGDLGDERLQPLGAAGTDHDMSTAPGEHTGDAFADPARRAGDGDDFPLDAGHEVLSSGFAGRGPRRLLEERCALGAPMR
jgi:hypothetical protein